VRTKNFCEKEREREREREKKKERKRERKRERGEGKRERRYGGLTIQSCAGRSHRKACLA